MNLNLFEKIDGRFIPVSTLNLSVSQTNELRERCYLYVYKRAVMEEAPNWLEVSDVSATCDIPEQIKYVAIFDMGGRLAGAFIEQQTKEVKGE